MLSPLLSDVRRVVFARLAASGAAPSIAAIAKELGAAEDDVRSALEELHEGHHLVLGSGTRLGPDGASVLGCADVLRVASARG